MSDDMDENIEAHKEERLNFGKGNYGLRSTFLRDINWDYDLQNKDIDIHHERFCEIINDGMAKCIPKCKSRYKQIKRWFNERCSKAKKENDLLWN